MMAICSGAACCVAQTTEPSSQPAAAPVSTRPSKQAGTQATTSAADSNKAMLNAALDLEKRAYTTQSPADYQAAADAFEKYSGIDSDNLEVERSAGFLWLNKLNNPQKALPHLEKAYAIAPDQTDWAITLAQAAGQAGKTDRQVEVLREVLKRDPNNSECKIELAEALGKFAPTTINSSKPPTIPAITSHEAMLQAAFALEATAYTTQTQADYQAAADAMEKCSKVTPNNDLERSVGFLWLDKLKNPAKAYPHLEIAYSLNPGDPGWGSLLAKAAGELDKTARQIQVLREVTTFHPDHSGSHIELAQALDKVGQHDQAGAEYAAALKLAPDDEGVLVPYARYLHARGRDADAKALADKVLQANPHSAGALEVEGDLHRSDWDLDQARAAYQQALAEDPESEAAKTGLTEIRRSQSPTLDTSYYYFKGTDHFMQQGLYNTLSLATSNHIYESASFNTGYFRDNSTKSPSVIRYQEGISIEDRVDNVVSIRAGLGAFQQPNKEAFGFDLGVTWKPTNQLWIDATYRTEDPVTDSMYTVANGLSQDILGVTGGYQFDDDLALKFAASRSEYSDNNIRQFIHIEPAYTVWRATQLRVGAEYETVRYSVTIPGAGGLEWYQTYGPVLEAEPHLTSWLWVHGRAEFPYVESARKWGTNLSANLVLHLDDHLEAKVGAFYVSVPESISSYSGSGFDASVSCRF
jgi:tetratricopeptide (TPR) repeat protein